MEMGELRDKFLHELQRLYDSQGIPLRTSVAVAKQPLDLYLLFMVVREKGGYGPVCYNKLWKDITTACGIKANPSSANSVKNHYLKHLLDFENELEMFVLSSAAPQQSTPESQTSTQQTDSAPPEQLVPSQHSPPPPDHPQFPVESNLSQQAEPTARSPVSDESCIPEPSITSPSHSEEKLPENIPEEKNSLAPESPVVTCKPTEIPCEVSEENESEKSSNPIPPSSEDPNSSNIVTDEAGDSKENQDKEHCQLAEEKNSLSLESPVVTCKPAEISREVSEENESQKSSTPIPLSAADPNSSNIVTDEAGDSKENQDKEHRQIKRWIDREESENKKDKSRDESFNNSLKRERKRRWGSSTGLGNASSEPAKLPTGISSGALKELIPELKKSHPQVSKTTEEQSQEVKETASTTAPSTPIAKDTVTKQSEQTSEFKSKIQDIDESSNLSEKKSGRISWPMTEIKSDLDDDMKHPVNLVVTGKSSVNPAKVSEQEASPAKNPTSNIIFIRNLVRPFTLIQLKELLNKTGKLLEEKFWIDKIKSKCYASYESQDEAIATRNALHGTRWPDANPKKLVVDFADEDELIFHLRSDDPSRASLGDSKSSNLEDEAKKGKNSDSIGPEKYDAAIRRNRIDDGDRLNDPKKEDPKERSESEKRPIREWDREKFDSRSQNDNQPPSKRPKEASSEWENRDRNEQSRDREKDRKSKENREEKATREGSSENRLVDDEGPMVKLLDDLFHKTKATPCIYWLPLDEEQAKKRAELREQNVRKREKEVANREAERRMRMEERRKSPFVRRDRSPVWRWRDHGGNRRWRQYQRRSRSPLRSRRSFSRSPSKSESRRRSKSRSISRSRSR